MKSRMAAQVHFTPWKLQNPMIWMGVIMLILTSCVRCSSAEENQTAVGKLEGCREKGRELACLRAVYFKDENGNTPLHLAVIKGDERAVMDLVKSGADLNARNKRWETPLILVGNSKHNTSLPVMLKYLIEQGVNVFAEDEQGQTFLHKLVSDKGLIISSDFHDIVEFLVSKNIASHLFSQPDNSQNTPMKIIQKTGKINNETEFLLKNNGVDFNTIGICPQSSEKSCGNAIRWTKVSSDQLPLTRMDVAGIQNGKKLYLAQVLHFKKPNMVYKLPAALKMDKDITAGFGAWGVEYTHYEFRILDAPSGSLSWVPHEVTGPIPSNAVLERHPVPNDGITYYMCRAVHLSDHIIPGRYWVPTRQCYYGFNGTEHSSNVELELLVVNKLGLFMGVKPTEEKIQHY